MEKHNNLLYRGEEMTPERLEEMVKEYQAIALPSMDDDYNYYMGKTKIKNRKMNNPNKPNHRVSLHLGSLVVDSINDYAIGGGVIFDSPDVEFLNDYLDTAVENDDDIMWKDVMTDVSIFGKGYLLSYVNEETEEFESLKIDPRNAFMVYREQRPKEPSYGVRFYGRRKETFIELYDQTTIKYFKKGDQGLELIEEVENFFIDKEGYGYIPLIEISNNLKQLSDLFPLKELIDVYELAKNGEFNEKEAFESAYMVLPGLPKMTEEEKKKMASSDSNVLATPAIPGLPVSNPYFMTKTIDTAYIQDYRNDILDTIFLIARMPNPFRMIYGKDVSGTAIEKMYKTLDTRIEYRVASLRKAVNRRARLFEVFREEMTGKTTDSRFNVVVKQNAFTSIKEQVEMAKLVQEVASEEAGLRQLPREIIGDVAEEQKRLDRERKGSVYPDEF